MSEQILFISKELLPLLFRKLACIRDARDEDLRELADVFGHPLDLARFYVEPSCQHQNPADYHEEDPVTIVRSAIFKTINAFFNREFAIASPGKNALVVLSDAGMGKTSLLMMLKLTHALSFWPSKFKCSLLKLGESTMEKIEAISDKSNTILLLDSLDEDPLCWNNTRGRLIEILQATQVFRRVVISCRTQFFPKGAADPFERPGRVEIGGYTCPMVFLSYFDEEQVEAYLEKRFRRNLFQKILAIVPPERMQARVLLGQMRSLQFRPFLLAHIEDLIASEKTGWDEYSIYDALVRTWLNREEAKLRQQGKAASMEQLLVACIAVSVAMQRESKRKLEDKALRLLATSEGSIENIAEFNFGGRSLLNRDSEGLYRFSHYSVQEFLVAKHVMQVVDPDEHHDGLRITDQVVAFISARDEAIRVKSLVLAERKQHWMVDGVCEKCGLSHSYIGYSNSICSSDSQGSRVTLFKRNMNRVRFDGVDIQGVNLAGSLLRQAQFCDVDLSRADLSDCDLSGAVFVRTALDGVNLAGSNLTDATFDRVDMASFEWSTAVIDGVVVKDDTTKKRG